MDGQLPAQASPMGLANPEPLVLYFLSLPGPPTRSRLADLGGLFASPSLDIKSCSWPECHHVFFPMAGGKGASRSEPWTEIQEAQSTPEPGGREPGERQV